MTPEEKKQRAVDFINGIRDMEDRELSDLIRREAGEELGNFFLNYSANLIRREPDRVLENTTSLMMMGYLLRASEEKVASGPTAWTPVIGRA